MVVGNPVIMKPSANVPQASLLMEKIFIESGFDNNEFQVLLVGHEELNEHVMPDKRIKLMIFTGGNKAGETVGRIAGESIRKVLLELGGSDPFIVLKDADIQKVNSNFN